MLHIENNISLKPYNTFGIDAVSRYFIRISSAGVLEELTSAYPDAAEKSLILGGGSNLLFTSNWDGWILKNECQGIAHLSEDDDYYYVKAAGGENWHQFVQYCIEHNYCGVENLSLIPGSVGASPIQNIGAYGVELKDVFYELQAWHLFDQTLITLKAADCAFGYRDSIFKNSLKGKLFILNVTFRLRKRPVFHTQYGAIQAELDKMGVQELSIQAVSAAIIRIRSSKLPDPAVTGNAGSFFKNPTIPVPQFEKLKNQFPDIPGYAGADTLVKLPAGWLIEQCGWKGFRKGDAGCYDKQALVLVNYGQAGGDEIFGLSEEIIQSVQNRFGITLEREVNIM
jgi:UDP-N-acetylmuramate dehydrogenase